MNKARDMERKLRHGSKAVMGAGVGAEARETTRETCEGPLRRKREVFLEDLYTITVT